jgi:hypothetical protein
MNTEKLNTKQWEQICADTVSKMAMHTQQYTTPISRALSEKEGEHLGTGSYFEIEGKKYILTNHHVAEYLTNNSLTHKFHNDDRILRLTNPVYAIQPPIDIAVSLIEDKSWNLFSHGSSAIPSNRFAKKYAPFNYELLFFVGYSGERSKFLFEHLVTRGTPYLTQECPFPGGVEEGNPNLHFSLPYKPDLAKSVDNKSFLPNPHGFSGSLVWDTKRISCFNSGKAWCPELADITGIVWGWPSSSACILATKVEFLQLNKITDL